MQKFSLLIDGRDVDTGIYEYFPYADNAITDFKNTYRMILKLKRGEDTGETSKHIFARYSIGDKDTNLHAIAAAHRASSTFRQFPVSKRLKILSDIHKNLTKNRDRFIQLLIIEGHPKSMAEWEYSCMERGYRAETLEFFKDGLWKEAGRFGRETIYWARKPDGVVTVSTPKNASASNSLTAAYALLGGNTLIVKPPLKAPIATIFLWKEVVHKAVKENGGPDGTINIVLGNSKQIMDEWLASPLVNDVFFFGDSKMGLEVGRKCYESGKKPILELSGNDTLFVWKDCDMEGALQSSLDAFLGSTQICMVPKTIAVHGDIYDRFIVRFLEKVNSLKYGLPSDPDTCLTPVLKIEEFFENLSDAVGKGGNVLCGGNRVNYRGVLDKNGIYLQPTVLSILDHEKALEMKCVREENFFPLLPVIKFDSLKRGAERDEEIFDKMISFARANEYGLRSSVWVQSYYYTRQFIKHLDNCGILRVNSRHVEFSHCLSTHGGTGKSGGPFGEMNYVWQKTTHLQGISLTRNRELRLGK